MCDELVLAAATERRIRFGGGRLPNELLNARFRAHCLGKRSESVDRFHRLDAVHAADHRHLEPIGRAGHPALDEAPEEAIGKPDG